jgi:hypothetical protein
LRAYTEINDFEHEIIEAGVIVIKFWLQISQEEQLKRFQEREQIEFKRFKITQEDWRNREKWDEYQVAICDMVERTSTGNAPWTLVEANDKNYARVKILRTVCQRLEAELNGRGAVSAGFNKKPDGKSDKAKPAEKPGKDERSDKASKGDRQDKPAKPEKEVKAVKSVKTSDAVKVAPVPPAVALPPEPPQKAAPVKAPRPPARRSQAKT